MVAVQIDENTSLFSGFSCTGILLSQKPLTQSHFYSHENTAGAYYCFQFHAR